MLPLDTSHTLQLLNINYFKLFKIAFHVYKDVWTLANKRKGARKEDLAQWLHWPSRKLSCLKAFAKILKQLA